jgi:hypothetical protein
VSQEVADSAAPKIHTLPSGHLEDARTPATIDLRRFPGKQVKKYLRVVEREEGG